MKPLYMLIQWVWGLPQNLLGALVFLCNRKAKRVWYHGALVTFWENRSSVSLGMFVFVTAEPFFFEKLKDRYSMEEQSRRLLVHEYGHTVQSLVLGPLYLILMGIPSTLWGFLPSVNRMRREQQVSYFSFFTERWANVLGEKITGERSMEMLIID